MKKLAIELFSGAGGLGLGLTQSGFEIILSNEIEKDFADTFKKNHANVNVLTNDIRDIDFKKEISKLGVPSIELVSGGPPCQGFSTIGPKNIRDSRNSLFYEYLRVIKEIKPNYLIFENVSGFYRLYNGIAYKTLLSELCSLGYDTCSDILDASDFGLPQIRKRTIVIGWKRGLIPVSMPIPTHQIKNDLFNLPEKITLMEAISDLPELRSNDSINEYKCRPLTNYQKEMRSNTKILTEHNSSNYGDKMKKILRLIPDGGSINDIPFALRPKKFFNNTYARLLANHPSPTITRNFGTPSSSRCVHPFQNRALSTREGARLQGFPDSYKFIGSKTSKNLQIGNSVPPLLGKILGIKIMESCFKNQTSRNTI